MNYKERVYLDDCPENQVYLCEQGNYTFFESDYKGSKVQSINLSNREAAFNWLRRSKDFEDLFSIIERQ